MTAQELLVEFWRLDEALCRAAALKLRGPGVAYLQRKRAEVLRELDKRGV